MRGSESRYVTKSEERVFVYQIVYLRKVKNCNESRLGVPDYEQDSLLCELLFLIDIVDLLNEVRKVRKVLRNWIRSENSQL